jgi:hypothetical protein
MTDTTKQDDQVDRDWLHPKDVIQTLRDRAWPYKQPVSTYATAVLAAYDKLASENATLRAAIDRVRALHAPQEYTIWSGARLQRCTHCRDESGYCVPYPCPTLRALDGEAA